MIKELNEYVFYIKQGDECEVNDILLVRRKKKYLILVIVFVFLMLVLVLVNKMIIPLRDSKDAISSIKNLQKYDVFTFGMYEQDNKTTNGKEEIEWIVLEKVNNKILVISAYALDCKPYNEERSDVTWADCTLRSWLNNYFFDSSFSEEEKDLISTSLLVDEKKSDSNESVVISDKVFLLSVDEVSSFLKNDIKRQCKPTTFAVANGAYARKEDNGNCWWWLRSPGKYRDSATIVFSDGRIIEEGNGFDIGFNAVRPAMWISLE